MILTSIWERYFLKETFKTFALFLFGFFGLYALIDYSSHAASFKHYHFTLLDTFKFYAFEFISRMDVLIPFAILIGTVRTLTSLNAHNELVALLASGITIKRILLPFVAFGLFFTLICYLGAEVLQPMASKYNTQLDHSRAKAKERKHAPIQKIVLEDGSSVLFQSYDAKTKAFYDSFWIRSINDIYRIKFLYPYADPPMGELVEHFERDDKGFISLVSSHPNMPLDEMRFNLGLIVKKLTESAKTPDALPLSDLKKQTEELHEQLNEKEARLLTTYYYKLTMPWICLLAAIAPAPFSVRFSRTLRVFFIYALSIFGLVFFYLVMDAAVILGERQMIYPPFAIGIPFASFFGFFALRFLRL